MCSPRRLIVMGVSSDCGRIGHAGLGMKLLCAGDEAEAREIASQLDDLNDLRRQMCEDGPTHQPIEHLASMRAIPNVNVFRPCDAIETAECGKDNPKSTRYCAFLLFLELCVGKFKKAKKI